MKKLSLILLSLAFVLVSCGNVEPDDPTRVTRPQDGNGKVFLENGTLVDATLDFTSEQLKAALSQYEWKQEYCFYYNNTEVKSRSDIGGMPLKIFTDGTMAFKWVVEGHSQFLFKDITQKGKLLIATHNPDPMSSAFLPATSYIVVALDVDDEVQRIVMDNVPNKDDENSAQRVRMVWYAVK